MTGSAVLHRVYASSGREVRILTLEIIIGTDRYYLTQGWDDIPAKLESGVDVMFTACAMDIALPARNADGTQDLRFAISNIDGVVSNRIRIALDANERMLITYREYLDAYLSAPAKRPWTMKVKGGYWTAPEVQITAGYMNVLDTAWPRRRFTLPEFPGLRYIS
jgi:hypothetical protein